MPLPEVCTTQQAAEILGLSVTTVQHLVEAGVIDAWKTKGGHRRIPLAVVYAYKRHHAPHPKATLALAKSIPVVSNATLLVVEENLTQRAIYREQIAHHNLPLSVLFCDTGYQALIEIATYKPDILLLNSTVDGNAAIHTIAFYPQLASIHIALLSDPSAQSPDVTGVIPGGVVVLQKPVNYDELSGYLRACCAQNMRRIRLA